MATITSQVDIDTYFEPLRDTDKFAIQKQIDFSSFTTAVSDTVQLLKVPANTMITDVRVIIDTAEGSAATGDVGDGDDVNGYMDAVDLNASVDVIDRNVEADPYGVGKIYREDDTIDFVTDTVLQTAKITVIAEGYKVLTS